MKQLSGLDASFLQLERGSTMLHGASLAIYDPATAPGKFIRYKDILRFYTSRIAQFPQFRRRLVTVPLALDRPWWIEEPEIDVEFHVRHIALPKPGDWRQLCIQVARLHSRRLDFSKPPWEVYVIEGLDNVEGVPPGSFALYTKMHHCAADGELGTAIIKTTHSIGPAIDDRGPPEAHVAVDRQPTQIELYSRAFLNGIDRIPAATRLAIRSAGRLGTLGVTTLREARARFGDYRQTWRALTRADLGAMLPKLPPATRFSTEVSVHRVFEGFGLPLDDFKQIRRHVPEATINDQFLALVGGGLRRYLEVKGELPADSMLAAVPLSLRGADKSQDGNQIGFTFMSVHTDIADPLERLRTIAVESGKNKQSVDILGKEFTRDLLEVLPNMLTEAIARYVKLPAAGLVVSNIRGPDVPLYMAGARMIRYLPISMLLNGTGLNVTSYSYDGTMWICAISCREMLPDPAFLTECMRESFEELKQAALGEPLREPRRAPASRTSRRKSSSKASRRKARRRTGAA